MRLKPVAIGAEEQVQRAQLERRIVEPRPAELALHGSQKLHQTPNLSADDAGREQLISG